MSEYKEHPIDTLGVLSDYVDDLAGLLELLLRTHEADKHAIRQAAKKLDLLACEEIFGTPTPYHKNNAMTQGEWGGAQGVALALLGMIHQQILTLEKTVKSVTFENALMRSEMETHGPAIQASAEEIERKEFEVVWTKQQAKAVRPGGKFIPTVAAK